PVAPAAVRELHRTEVLLHPRERLLGLPAGPVPAGDPQGQRRELGVGMVPVASRAVWEGALVRPGSIVVLAGNQAPGKGADQSILLRRVEPVEKEDGGGQLIGRV